MKALKIVNDEQEKLDLAEKKLIECLHGFRPVHHKRAAEEKKRLEEKELRKNLPAGNLMARLQGVRKKKKAGLAQGVMAGPLARLAALKREVDAKKAKAMQEAQKAITDKFKNLGKKKSYKKNDDEDSCSIMEDAPSEN